MPKIPTFVKEVDLKVLANNSSASYTQSWSTIFQDFERVAYIIIGHASVDVVFNVQIASDSSGTGAASVFTNVTTPITASAGYILDVGPGILTAAKQYVSVLVTRNAGTYTLLRARYNSRNPGSFSLDSSFAAYQSLYI